MRKCGMAGLVLLNGRVFTARPGEPPFTGGVAIVGERIVAVGGDAAARAAAPPDARQIDVHGRSILPGFVAMFVVAISATVMPWRRPDLYEGSPADWKVAGIRVLPICGALGAAVLAFFIVLPFFYQDQLGLNKWPWLPWATAIAPIVVILLGIAWWMAARSYHRSRGVDLDLLYRTIPPD